LLSVASTPRGGEPKEAPAQLSDQIKPIEKLTLAQELNDEIPTFAESDSSKPDSTKKKTKKK
jgi:hypothetical protein